MAEIAIKHLEALRAHAGRFLSRKMGPEDEEIYAAFEDATHSLERAHRAASPTVRVADNSLRELAAFARDDVVHAASPWEKYPTLFAAVGRAHDALGIDDPEFETAAHRGDPEFDIGGGL